MLAIESAGGAEISIPVRKGRETSGPLATLGEREREKASRSSGMFEQQRDALERGRGTQRRMRAHGARARQNREVKTRGNGKGRRHRREVPTVRFLQRSEERTRVDVPEKGRWGRSPTQGKKRDTCGGLTYLGKGKRGGKHLPGRKERRPINPPSFGR